MLNRSAVIVRPKQPYRDWAAGMGEDGPKLLPYIDEERTIYLIPDFEYDEDEE